jgi:hypothetical protein
VTLPDAQAKLAALPKSRVDTVAARAWSLEALDGRCPPSPRP